jgi:hypothetical protein
MNELANFTPPYTTLAYSIPHGPIPDNVYGELLKCAPVSSVQTMAPTSSAAHRLTSAAQTSSSGSYKAIFLDLKKIWLI